MPVRPTEHEALPPLFHPRAIAVIGASDDTTRHGHIVLANLRNTGFTGGIIGISRRLTVVDINPVILGKSGAIAVDALLEPTA
jgi:acyl-CoA synthetase (NDP forming)